jgi:hypothetical protein
MLLIDGFRSITVPLLEKTQQLKMINVLFAHLFPFLTNSQAMPMYQIDPSKRLTVKALMDVYFPAIKSTQDQPTPFVSARTIGYIHAIVIDTVSANHSSLVHARAIQNETTTRGDLDKWDSSILLIDLYDRMRRKHSQDARHKQSPCGCPPHPFVSDIQQWKLCLRALLAERRRMRRKRR